MESLLGDCAGPGSIYDTTRQHLSTYGWAHYGDLDPSEPQGLPSGLVEMLDRGLSLVDPAPPGLTVDIGCSVGRTTFELAKRRDGLVVGIDIHVPMLRMAQQVLRSGQARFPLRKGGLVYDMREVEARFEDHQRVDFWAADAQALPLREGSVALLNSMNLLDCLPAPYAHLRGLGALLSPDGVACFATPYDWSPTATPVEAWLGGHSQRTPQGGMSDRLVRSLLTSDHPGAIADLEWVGEIERAPWNMRLHDRSRLTYDVHVFAVRRARNFGQP
jgi:SAM-dependent methyltransferase